MQEKLSFYIKSLTKIRGFSLAVICALSIAYSPGMAKTTWASSGGESAQVTIVYSIQPLALIGREVLGDHATHLTLLPPGSSPHDYVLRISDIKRLQQADIIVWMGPEIEPYLVKILGKIGAEQKKPKLIDANKIVSRTTTQPSDRTSLHAHDHHGDRHLEGRGQRIEYDPHIWLSPSHASRIANALEKAFRHFANKEQDSILENVQRFREKINAMSSQGKEGNLANISYKPYIVYHDAFIYLENYLGIQNSGAITDNLHNRPGVQSTVHMVKKIQALQPSCVLTPLNYDVRLMAKIVGENSMHVVKIDILAEAVADDTLYTEYLNSMIASVKACIAYQVTFN